MCGRPTQGRKCPEHQRQDSQRRWQKQKASGRNLRAWRQLREQAFARDGYRCRLCGSTDRLTGHLDPAYQGRHDDAPLEAVVTLCISCHGSVDAPRAHRQE